MVSLLDEAPALRAKLLAAMETSPSPAADADQPVHTVYCPADRFDAETCARLGRDASALLLRCAQTPEALARVLGWPGVASSSLGAAADARRFATDSNAMKAAAPQTWFAYAVWHRVAARLQACAVEDIRIDFEDGYGNRVDATEDAHADAAADAVADAVVAGTMSPRCGLRIKSLTPELLPRAARTLERFVDGLARREAWPQTLVVTLPKVTCPEQVRLADAWLGALEARHQRPQGSIRMEAMVETTETLIDASGSSPLPAIVDAGTPRLLGIHIGIYDYTASVQLPPQQQHPGHVYCDLARGLLRLAVGNRVHVSDGASNVVPTGTVEAVHRAWRVGYDHVTRALAQGYVQGWDMHAGQLVVRHAANIAAALHDYDTIAARLSAMLNNATSTSGALTVEGQLIDEPATGRAMLRCVQRAWRVGALTEAELAQAGVQAGELTAPSFTALVQARRALG